mmetsp:Transcript_54967/g.154623  ORF Transcript_54967/g.154623 Transcript_54967/m.154623 type:complete len:227 (-) Transcript_54967:13-693(-)
MPDESENEDEEGPDGEEEPSTDAAASPAEPEKPKEEKPPEDPFKPHDAYPPMQGAAEIEYCPVCGLPPDFCIFGPSWDKCKPVCMERFPHYYPELSGASLDDAKKTAQAAADKGKEKLLPGGKKKRESSPHVRIKKLTRSGRKCVTSVVGLEMFDIKLEAVAKLFKKKFACGCSVVAGDNGSPDCVDIQGDFEMEVVELIMSEYKLPQSKITVLPDEVKKKGKSAK